MTSLKNDFEISRVGEGEILATPDGSKWLEEHQSFVAIMTEFTRTNLEAVHFLRNQPGIDYVKMGSNSTILAVDGKALKVASPFSGRRANRSGRPEKSEDLFQQLEFSVMVADRLSEYGKRIVDEEIELVAGTGEDSHMNEHAQIQSYHEIMTPNQYFALSGPTGNLKLEELMSTDWKTLGDLATMRNFDKVKRLDVNEAVKKRITAAVGKTMTMAMDFGQGLQNHNVLALDSSRPETGPLCIIDQPSSRLIGKLLAPLLLKKH